MGTSTSPVRTTRRGRVVVGVLLAAVLGAGGTAAVLLDDAGEQADVEAGPLAPLPSAAPERPPLLAPAGGGEQPPLPTAAGLQGLVDAALADPAVGGRLAVSIVDAGDGALLLERDSARLLLPASKAKIVTAVAVLAAVDPQTRLTTRVLAGPEPGDVVLVGGGDTTLTVGAGSGYPRPARLADLATRVRAVLGAQPVTRVLVDDALYSGPRTGPGWRPNYVPEGSVGPVSALSVDGGRVQPGRNARAADPAIAAGQAFAALVGAPPATVARGSAPDGARVLGVVRSPTVAGLVEKMLTDSDNDLAESLARQVALAEGQPATFEGAGVATREVLGGYLESVGVSREAVRLVDGSGLSRDNLLQPAALTRLLVAVAARDGDRFATVLTGLPVAGFDGTLARRYREGEAVPAAGVVRGKTGTLMGVSALAGVVRTREGRLLAFDVTADGVPPGATRAAERAIDRLAAQLASCGCR